MSKAWLVLALCGACISLGVWKLAPLWFQIGYVIFMVAGLITLSHLCKTAEEYDDYHG